MSHYSGKSKIEFCHRLGKDWQDLADYFKIPYNQRSQFENGRECQGIWEWLELRDKLLKLPEALEFLKREDLLSVFEACQNPSEVVLKQQSDSSKPLKTASKYVERPPIEANCYREISKPGSLIRIKAPTKMGKTQLMNKILEHAKEKGYRTITLDISLAGAKNLSELDKFLRWIGAVVTEKLSNELVNLSNKLDIFWKTDLGSNYNLTRYFEQYLLPAITSYLVLALDNVDLVFENSETSTDFCRTLRSWNQAAVGSNSHFKKLHLIVVHSTEIYTTLNINTSPLAGVGLTVDLPEFTFIQVHNLIQQYQFSWNESDIKKLMELVGGHPYLVIKAFEQVVQQQCPLQALLQTAHTDSGIYGNHLWQLLLDLEKKPNLLDAMKKVLATSKAVRLDDTTSKFQLQRMGLLRLQNNKVTISRELYRKYFCDCL